jgi:hypothetical protein
MPTSVPAPLSSANGEVPVREAISDNVHKPELARMVALNFRVPAEFKKNFKIAAATYGIKQSELLQQAFAEWMQRHGMAAA